MHLHSALVFVKEKPHYRKKAQYKTATCDMEWRDVHPVLYATPTILAFFCLIIPWGLLNMIVHFLAEIKDCHFFKCCVSSGSSSLELQFWFVTVGLESPLPIAESYVCSLTSEV